MLAFVECPTLYAATAQPPQFTFSSTSSFRTTGSYKAPTAATPRATSFRTTSAFRNYGTHRTYTVIPQHIAHRSISSISTNYRPTPSISANYRSYVSRSTAPTYQSSQQRTHSYQGGTSAIATSIPAARSTTHSTIPHSASTTSIPTVSTTTLSHTSSSHPNSDLTSTTPQPSTTPNSSISNSTPQPATHLYHTFSALHSSATTGSTTIPTLPTIHKAGEVVWGNKLYDEDGNEIGYIDSEGKVWKDGNIIGTWHNGHFTTQGEPVQNPVGSPLCLLLFAITYFIYKRHQLRHAQAE